MRFSNPAWREKPIRTFYRAALSIFLKRLPFHFKPIVDYDHGRSRIFADLTSPLGLELFRYGQPRIAELDLATSLLRPGDVFIDAGANIGLFTLAGAQKVGPKGKVLAIEASPTTYKKLKSNIELNQFSWISPLCVALSDQAGSQSLFFADGLSHLISNSSDRKQPDEKIEKVETQTLDELVKKERISSVDFIKMDIEGAETKALLGAQNLLKQSSPHLLIEVNVEALLRQSTTAETLIRTLLDMGYQCYEILYSQSGEIKLKPSPAYRITQGSDNLLFSKKTDDLRTRIQIIGSV